MNSGQMFLRVPVERNGGTIVSGTGQWTGHQEGNQKIEVMKTPMSHVSPV